MKINLQNIALRSKKNFWLIFTLLVIASISLFINCKICNKNYSIFIEFSNAYGIKPGTMLRLRGLSIGHIVNVKLGLNTILVFAKINSSLIVIPRNVLIETNQTGLLNEAIVDIFPLENIEIMDQQLINPLSSDCLNSKIVCHLSHLKGDRGLNYDDLVRATTRISQRFDDPRFFNLFYTFLHNGIELSHNVVYISTYLLDLLYKLQKKI
jgi:phospholipid/cholesterol/gamma-HCH transport system substrate-binding protein